MFHVGQKVACIGDYEGVIKKGQVLTISYIYPNNPLWVKYGEQFRNIVGLEFVEVPSPPFPRSGYSSSAFRPVVDKKTDISVFTRMLKTTKTKERL